MASGKWDPFRELNKMIATRWEPLPWNPSVAITETESQIIVKADLPGLRTHDIDIRLEHNALLLKVQRRTEREYGSFSRTFSLPSGVKENEVKADYKNGVLIITMPKKEEVRTGPIRIDAA